MIGIIAVVVSGLAFFGGMTLLLYRLAKEVNAAK